ncbi:MAG: LPS export ABC transporter periplasmic protein LptC [Bacteroidales bacterium]|nr:LPS export ABC transporter periplasmic protein LptC [Candidatus Cacconaster merdequi]
MATLTVAIMLLSCKQQTVEPYDFSVVPKQVVNDMSVLKTNNGNPEMRMKAPVMQGFDYVKDSVHCSYEFYPDGFHVEAFTDDGELETTIDALQAKHVTSKDCESWSAFGDVVVTNHIKGESLFTDTIYWNREEQRIYTDCYVRLESYSGMMQGYGMNSDERARNTVILRPFENYYIMRDSGDVFLDTLNALGPVPKRSDTQLQK